jgi:2-dehydropantoate 2-reductase
VILVVGAGAVGSFIGATLAAGGRDVTLLGRAMSAPAGSRAAGVSREIALVGPGDETRSAAVTLAGSVEALSTAPELLVTAVKMNDLDGAIETIARWPDVPVLALENGIGADEMLRAAGRNDIIAGSLTTSIELDRGSWTVRRRSRGGIGLAPVSGDVEGTIGQLVTAFEAGSLRARRLPNGPQMRWSKLLANLLGNATSAILDLDAGDVYHNVGLFAVEWRQLREALAAMRGLGLSPAALPGSDVRALAVAARLPGPMVRPVMARVVAMGRGGKSPSLRRHLQHGGGPSEVDWLNGAVAATARRLGLPAPVNAGLAELVSECSRDAERWAWFRGRPERLLAALAPD